MACDARVRYTKKVIDESFISLLKEKPINKITVTNICKLSEINRATFYKYHKDPYDWVEKREKEALELAQELINSLETTDIQTILIKAFDCISSNINLYRVLFATNENITNSNIPFLVNLFDICYQKSLPNHDIFFYQVPKSEQDYNYYFLYYGCVGAIRCWLEKGMQQAPEEVAAYVANRIDRFLSYESTHTSKDKKEH